MLLKVGFTVYADDSEDRFGRAFANGRRPELCKYVAPQFVTQLSLLVTDTVEQSVGNSVTH